MSNLPSTSSSRLNLDALFNAALRAYKNQTGKDIASHPLATELQSCDSPDAMLTVLRRQIPIPDQSQNVDEPLEKCLVPTISVLCALSDTLGEGVGLVNITLSFLSRIAPLTSLSQVFSPAKVIFTGIGILLLVGYLLFSLYSPF